VTVAASVVGAGFPGATSDRRPGDGAGAAPPGYGPTVKRVSSIVPKIIPVPASVRAVRTR
jgi:hypothetical protein